VERNFSIFSWVKQTSNIQNQTKNKRKTSGFGAGGRNQFTCMSQRAKRKTWNLSDITWSWQHVKKREKISPKEGGVTGSRGLGSRWWKTTRTWQKPSDNIHVANANKQQVQKNSW